MLIYCCQCKVEVECRLTDGHEIYPHRTDLARLPFWKCDGCKGYVGCHYKTGKPTKPLGNIATGEMKKVRQHIHSLIDPAWKFGGMNRREIYGRLSKAIGYEYHTGELRTIEEARRVYAIAKTIVGPSPAPVAPSQIPR